MQSYRTVDFNTGYTPSSEEQRAAVEAQRNALNRKRYNLKRAAHELGRLSRQRVRTVALIVERHRHG